MCSGGARAPSKPLILHPWGLVQAGLCIGAAYTYCPLDLLGTSVILQRLYIRVPCAVNKNVQGNGMAIPLGRFFLT